jgi:putative membrane protein insertion efficiency factor
MQRLHNKILLVLFIIIASLLYSHKGTAQKINIEENMTFFSKQNSSHSHSHKRPYIFKNEKNILIKYNPVSLTLGGMLYFYQNVISQQLSSNCLYQPTCSDFSKQAIAEYGIFKGIFLSTDRLTRCNKISGIDIHPVTMNEKTNKSEDPVSLYK